MIHVVVRGKRQRLTGFTLVELLVVIAIIGVLVSILLPAVGAVRDSARRTENTNNLRNIGTAILLHEESRGTLPALMKRSVEDPTDLTKSVSWAFQILPYLELGNIYDRYDDSKACFAPENQVAMGTPTSVYANPRSRDPRGDRSYAKSQLATGSSLDYAVNGGTIVDDNRQAVRLPSRRPNPSSRYPYDQDFDPKFSGPFHASQAVSTAAVGDGLSNTLCVGDRWIGPGSGVNDQAGLAGDSFFTTVRFSNLGESTQLPFPDSKQETSVYKFGSPRGNDACFVFLDGRAQWVPYDVDKNVFQALSSIKDGFVIPGDWDD